MVAKLRGVLKERRIGHCGTLDPMATGVLPILLGKATPASDILPEQSKRYTAGITFGITTDTQDTTGEVTRECTPSFTEQDLLTALEKFSGDIMQLPPMYSAVSKNGVRLYKLARQGIEVEREARPITIYSIKLLEFDSENYTAVVDFHCSKGTYVRTLAHDIGQELQCGAAMSSLRRTMSCGYDLSVSYTLDDIQKLKDSGEVESIILPIDSAFSLYPQLDLNERQAQLLQNGVRMRGENLGKPIDGQYRLYLDGSFIGLGLFSDNAMRLKRLT